MNIAEVFLIVLGLFTLAYGYNNENIPYIGVGVIVLFMGIISAVLK